MKMELTVSDSDSEELALALADTYKPNEYDCDDEPAVSRVRELMEKQNSDARHEKSLL